MKGKLKRCECGHSINKHRGLWSYCKVESCPCEAFRIKMGVYRNE